MKTCDVVRRSVYELHDELHDRRDHYARECLNEAVHQLTLARIALAASARTAPASRSETPGNCQQPPVTFPQVIPDNLDKPQGTDPPGEVF